MTYALTIFFAATLRYAERIRWLVDVQLAADVLIVSAFIYVTGGVASYFSPLYVLPIVAASTVQFRRGGLLVALLSTVVFLGMVVGQYCGLGDCSWTPCGTCRRSSCRRRSVAQYTVALNVFVFFAIALLSGSLAEELRSTGARLGAGVDGNRRPAGAQPARHRQPAERSGDDRSAAAHPDVQSRARKHHRRRRSGGGRDGGSPRCCSCPRRWSRSSTPVWPAASRGATSSPTGRADGRGDIEVGLSATHLETPGGRAGFLFSFQDVTTIKKLARDAALQQRLAAVGEMAAGIAHEIRNPLASISGSIQILRQELPLTADQELLMDIVRRESERLNETIQSFLAYARPQRLPPPVSMCAAR